jgi:Predicted membrane protein
MWKYYAILSAVFAAITAIFAKIGIKNVDSNLATAIRTCVILIITWGIVLFSNSINGVKELTKINWLFLILSGIATGLSWLFYFKALQLGDASKVAPIDKLSVIFTIFLSFIILKESVSWKVLLGGLLIAGGSLIILMDKQ